MQTQTELKNELTYTDSELDLEQPYLYSLEVCIAENKLSFCIHQQKRIFGLKVIPVNESTLKGSIQNHPWSSLTFNNTRIFIDNPVFTIVPEALFENSKPAAYLSLVHQDTEQEQILSYKLLSAQAVCVFSLNTGLYSSLKQQFNSAQIQHNNSVLLAIASHFNPGELRHNLLVNINAGFITILSVVNNEIHYCNSFDVSSDTDLVYYVLSVAGLFKLPADKFGVIVSGEVSSSSPLLALLKKYIPNVHTINRLDDVQYPLSFREFQDQQNYCAIHSLLCE